jgi:hypothetical protein
MRGVLTLLYVRREELKLQLIKGVKNEEDKVHRAHIYSKPLTGLDDGRMRWM